MTEGLGEALWIRIIGGLILYHLEIIQNFFNKKIRINNNSSSSSNGQIESGDMRRAVNIVLNKKQDIWRMDLLVKTITSCSKVNTST